MNVAQRLTSIYPSPAEDVRRLAGNIHELVDRTEYGARYFLENIDALGQSGFSPKTLLAIHLTNDAKALRALADQIDTIRTKLTQED